MVDEDVPLGLGVLGQETTGPGGICFALRTIPVMVRLAETMAKHAPNAWLINFTNPAGMVTEAVQQVLGDRAVGICDSPSGLCRRVAAAVGRDPEELWFDYFGLNHLGWLRGVRDASGEAAARRPARGRRAPGRLRGGPAVRRRVAALARDDPERVPLLLLLRRRHGQRRSAASQPRAARSCSSSSARSTRATAKRRSRRWPTWRATRHDRERTYMAEARNAAGDDHEHEGDANGGYENEAMAVLEAIALNTRAGADPQHREPLRAAVPGRARRGRGAVRRRPRRPGPDGDRRGPRPRAGAGRDDEGRRAHDDRRGAAGLARSSRSRRSRCTRSCRRSTPRGRSSTATAQRLPALQEAFA